MNKLLVLTAIISLLTISCTNQEEQTSPTSYEYSFQNPGLSIEERANDLVSRLSLEEKVEQMMSSAPAIERLGIPAYDWWNEALHGVARSGKATVFPQAIALAATFDTTLIYDMASAISDEARAKFNIAQSIGNRGRYAGLTFWSPNVNIFRDPRWGRGQETYGEDPFLSSKIGVAFVKGLQGDDSDVLKAAACAKHFVVHSGPEKLRHEFNAIASPRDLQETYFPAFKALTDAGVEGFMCAYNKTNDEPCCGSSHLLTEILRDQWNFDGYITSDCGAIRDFYDGHDYSDSPAAAAALAVRSGVNLNCGSVLDPHLLEAVEKGLITEAEINASLKQLLKTRFRLGLFDPENMDPYRDYGEEMVNAEAHRELARQTAEEAMVLLKNDDVLPIKKDISSIYLIGPYAINSNVLLGNYSGVSPELVTFVEGITAKASPGTSIMYRQGFLPDRENINPIDWTTGNVSSSDITFVFCGISPLIESEEGAAIASEYFGDRYDYGLPDNQVNFIKKIAERKEDKPVVLVVTGGSPIDLAEVEQYADAIIFAWYPGEEGGHALANLIFGDRNFSGRLPITFPASLDQLPDYENYNMEGRTYKYMNVDPLYPFGYGMSYSSFEYTGIRSEQKRLDNNSGFEVNVSLRNSGTFDGEEVVQLYCTFPEAAEDAPNYRLIAFDKIQLDAGTSGEVTFRISPKDLISYDNEGNSILVPGNYNLIAGGASPMPKSRELGVGFREVSILVE